MFSVVAVVVDADEMPVAIVCELNDGMVTDVYTSLSVLSRTPVPVKVGCVELAELMPVAMVCELNDGRVTAVGVFVVNPRVSVSFDTVALKLAAVPAVTEPPPVALAATYFDVVLGVTVMVGVLTLPAGVYVAVPLEAGLTVTVPFVALPPPVALDATYLLVVEGVTVVVYVFGTATVPLALFLKASEPSPDKSPNSCHDVPLNINSALPYVAMFPFFAVTETLLMVIGFVVAPSVRAVVVTPRKSV